ncbi:MAG: MarR family transcriptional regulator [Polyangiaceae bacterium]
MVNPLDENSFPPLLDHIGWLLWRAARDWKRELDEGMVEMGYAWATEARANVLPHVGRAGIAQSELSGRMGVSKQAVQQLLDELVADGIVERKPDPTDRRGRLVVLTAAGRKFVADANVVKLRIEASYRARLGERRFAQLTRALQALHEG